MIATCPACKCEVRWAKNRKDGWMALDPEPIDRGERFAVEEDSIRGPVAFRVDVGWGHQAHVRSCQGLSGPG